MKQDPTIGEVIGAFIQRVRSAPRQMLDVRVSTIWRGLTSSLRILVMLLSIAAYVVIVLVLGQVLGHRWHGHSLEFFYVCAFVFAPFSFLRGWWRGRKAHK